VWCAKKKFLQKKKRVIKGQVSKGRSSGKWGGRNTKIAGEREGGETSWKGGANDKVSGGGGSKRKAGLASRRGKEDRMNAKGESKAWGGGREDFGGKGQETGGGKKKGILNLTKKIGRGSFGVLGGGANPPYQGRGDWVTDQQKPDGSKVKGLKGVKKTETHSKPGNKSGDTGGTFQKKLRGKGLKRGTLTVGKGGAKNLRKKEKNKKPKRKTIAGGGGGENAKKRFPSWGSKRRGGGETQKKGESGGKKTNGWNERGIKEGG